MNIQTNSLALLLLSGGLYAAPIQQWTDADGQTHYGDTAPAGIVATQPDMRPAFRSDSPGLRASERRALKRIRKSEQRRASARDRANKDYWKKRRAKVAFCEESARELEHLISERDPESRWTRSDLHKQRRDANCF